MTRRTETAVRALERAVTSLGERVETQLDSAIAALLRRDPMIADEVVRGDDEIDAADVRIEREGLEIMASCRLAPVELRIVAGSLRIVTQIERIGDLAVNLAERAVDLAAQQPLPPFEGFAGMAARVQSMLRTSLVSLAQRDAEAAANVFALDLAVDAAHREAFELYEGLMRAEPRTIDRAVQMLSCTRHLERIGDHAKNVAEDVIFIAEGRIVRHARPSSPRGEPILVHAGPAPARPVVVAS